MKERKIGLLRKKGAPVKSEVVEEWNVNQLAEHRKPVSCFWRPGKEVHGNMPYRHAPSRQIHVQCCTNML